VELVVYCQLQFVEVAPAMGLWLVSLGLLLLGSSALTMNTLRAEGNLWVSDRCIDCDVCRWLAPETFGSCKGGGRSIVHTQPLGEQTKLAAYTALVACPVGAIRTKIPDTLVKSVDPIVPIDAKELPSVYHLAHHAESSYGATPYLIQTAATNRVVMIDSPRYSKDLADSVEQRFGQVSFMILTHQDDVADHAKWAARFPGLQRVMHEDDVSSDTCNVELKICGDVSILPDLRVIFTPGHTKGSICALYEPRSGASCLFSGDHLALSENNTGELTVFFDYNWHSIELQRASIAKLNEPGIEFQWLLPGHGRRARFASGQQRREMVTSAATWGVQVNEL